MRRFGRRPCLFMLSLVKFYPILPLNKTPWAHAPVTQTHFYRGHLSLVSCCLMITVSLILKHMIQAFWQIVHDGLCIFHPSSHPAHFWSVFHPRGHYRELWVTGSGSYRHCQAGRSYMFTAGSGSAIEFTALCASQAGPVCDIARLRQSAGAPSLPHRPLLAAVSLACITSMLRSGLSLH